jgi:hypothetical protein
MAVEYAPTQTAKYSDSQLIDIVTTGAKPAGGTFVSPFLSDLPLSDCIFAALRLLSTRPSS